MRKKILIGCGGLGAVFALFLIVVAMQPSEFHVTRSITISAQPDVVFNQVNNLHEWQAWSPWSKLDPAAENSFEGPDAGEGAVFNWSGNSKIGAGSMQIVDSKAPEVVRMKLHFVRPMEDTCDTEFAFQSRGNETKVTWTMSGKNNFMGKAFCLFMNMDKMLGDQFNEGLANMKAIVEAKTTGPVGESEMAAQTAPTAES